MNEILNESGSENDNSTEVQKNNVQELTIRANSMVRSEFSPGMDQQDGSRIRHLSRFDVENPASAYSPELQEIINYEGKYSYSTTVYDFDIKKGHPLAVSDRWAKDDSEIKRIYSTEDPELIQILDEKYPLGSGTLDAVQASFDKE